MACCYSRTRVARCHHATLTLWLALSPLSAQSAALLPCPALPCVLGPALHGPALTALPCCLPCPQAFAGIVTVSVGHCHPTVTKAVTDQLHHLQVGVGGWGGVGLCLHTWGWVGICGWVGGWGCGEGVGHRGRGLACQAGPALAARLARLSASSAPPEQGITRQARVLGVLASCHCPAVTVQLSLVSCHGGHCQRAY